MSGEPVLVLDIDSSSVGSCFMQELDGVPHVSAVRRTPLGTGAARDPSALSNSLKEALAGVMPTYAKAQPKLRDVKVVVASPWYAASIRTLSSKSEKPVKVSQSSIRRIVADHRKTEHEAEGKVTLEVLPVTVLVNGYRTHVLHAVRGKTLSITLFESIADQAFVETVRGAIASVLPRAKLSWHTTPLVYAETLLRLSDEDHATIVDVGGEVTDVFILSHQDIAYTGSIPVGARTIARAALGGDDKLADSMSRLVMFSKGELSQKEMEATAAALVTGAKDWQTQFVRMLAEAGNHVPVPHRVFIVGERDELSWFSQIVTGAEMRGQRPLPKIVGAEFFSGLLRYGEGGVFDASLALDALFFHMPKVAVRDTQVTPPVLYSVQ